MTDRLLALKLFVRVADTGGFSRAGKDLRLSQPSASRLIASLEREVGAALFTRSTRAVVLTEVGSDYLAKVEPALAILEEATQAIHGGACFAACSG
jgi:DNA-binding transcriptional LysR family regulator